IGAKIGAKRKTGVYVPNVETLRLVRDERAVLDRPTIRSGRQRYALGRPRRRCRPSPLSAQATPFWSHNCPCRTLRRVARQSAEYARFLRRLRAARQTAGAGAGGGLPGTPKKAG